MAKGKQAIFVRHSFLVNIKELSMAERGRLFTAMLEYSITGKEPVLGGSERYIWPAAKLMIDEDAAAYQKIVEQRQAAAGKRWSTDAGACESMREMQYININPTSTINTSLGKETLSIERVEKRFVAPTVDDVRSYCDERHSSVDPETFVNFYASKGWMVGKSPMKDWKAAVRGWEQRDRKETRPKKPGRFDALNEAIRKELANGSGRNNGVHISDGKALVELPDTGDT